jgi:WD40 repeat protein
MWDVRNLRCIHTIDTADEAAAALKTADICAIAEDGPRKRIILGSTSLQAWSLRSVINATKEVSHTAPVVSCVFNPGFDQVVSTDTNGGVRIWSIDTGELVTRWSTHGELKEGVEPLPSQQMTALCFDDGGRRMITGSHGGMRVQARRVLKP